KDFFPGNGHVRGDVSKYRRTHVVAAVETLRPSGPAANQRRAFLNALFDKSLDFVELRLADQRPHLRSRVLRIADFDLLGRLLGQRHNLITLRALDQQASWLLERLTGVGV